MTAPTITAIVPCNNEERTIGEVVRALQAALPGARIVVCDNASTDGTAEAARAAGALVLVEPNAGKGRAVRRLFADIESDLYVMLDGDGTYDAASAPLLMRALLERQVDMVVGRRVAALDEAYRPGHALANRLLNRIVAGLFQARFHDMLSGYRVLSRRFVKSFPALSEGFEIETELTVHALELAIPVAEVNTPYRPRPEGSQSKLRTWHDGFRILGTIALLLKEVRPLLFFGTLALALALLSVALGTPVVLTYLHTGLVPRLPTAVLASGVMVLAFVGLTCGLVLDSVARGRREMKRLRYLEFPATGQAS